MFDFPTFAHRDVAIEEVRLFFFDWGHELAEAAGMLGGGAAEARVVSCGNHLENARSVDTKIRRDLQAIYRLLALETVGDPDTIESEMFAAFDPASPQVERICLLTDRLEKLLQAIDPANSAHAQGAAA